MQRALSYPFRFEAGGVAASLTEQDIWKDRVYIAIFTGYRERVMNPGYGTVISSSLFEDMDSAAEIANDAITTAFSTWLTQLTLLGVNSTEDLDTSELIVEVNYRLPSDIIDTLKFRVSLLERTGQIIQEF